MIGSIVLLARNENHFVVTKAGLNEGEKLVQDADAQQLNPELDGKLVHIQGVTPALLHHHSKIQDLELRRMI